MTEETQNEEVNTEPEQTLDDVYKESGITEAQPQIQAAPQPQQSPEVDIPDPYDVDRYKNFMQTVVRNQTALQHSLQAALGTISKTERETQAAKLEEEISQATEFVSKEAGIENKELAHFELEQRARTDPKFKALWDNRNNTSQSKSAFTKALGIISKEIGNKYEVRADPQLIANRRALKASQQSSATTETPETDEWGSKTGRDFEQHWQNLISPRN